tara:strand:- start:2098 stop:2466 length:369 start_codon:yes stop_codon:yes gene_type:complete
MKLRIKGNSIRFRLTQSEVEIVEQTGLVKDQIKFSDSISLEYEIKAATGLEYVEATYSENKITLKVNESLIRDWAHSDQVTISSSLDLSSNENLTILIEKDFKCLSPRDEDESDMFPHPKQQ